MSVPNQIPYNIYTANGQTTVFTYEFYIISASDLEVSINGSVVASGYTVSGVGNKDGGDITFLTPPANGAVVMLERVVPTYRLTDYQDNGDLLADTVNKDFDRIWMAIQRAFIDLGFALTRPYFGGPFNAKGYRIENLADPVNDQDAATKKYVIEQGKLSLVRALRVPESNVGIVPPVNVRSNMLLGFNDLGNPVAIAGQTDTADLALKLASTAGASLVGTENGLTVQEMLSLGRIVYPEMFGVGLSEPSDDELWSAMFAALEALPDTLLGTSLPYTVDLRGNIYTLTQTHNVDVNINIINGTLLMNGGQVVISNELVGSRTRRVILKDLKVRYTGTTYYPEALIKIARCYNSFVINCDFWAGDTTDVISDPESENIGKPLRARYGLWMGSKRAWGCGIIGGEFFGGEICCRIGYTNDHTGITVSGGATFHHGWVGNLLLCNPAGFSVNGCNIEHSENGAWGLCITSGTNASLGNINHSHGGMISGCYLYNNGNGSPGDINASAAILIGYDVPGTLNFDIPGGLITSQATAHSIQVTNCYIVSPKQQRAVKMRGLYGLNCLNSKYTFATTESYGFTIEGTSARSSVRDCRNQSTGASDEAEYTSSNKPQVGGAGGMFTPQLKGKSTAGVMVYSTRGGDYFIENGICKLSLWLTVGPITTQPEGDLYITLPVAIAFGRRSGCGVSHQALAGTTTVNVSGEVDGSDTSTVTGTAEIPNSYLSVGASIINGTTLSLKLGGAPMQGSVIRETTAFELSIEYPVNGATFTG
ncbi:phage tail fiber domain-containing protein [Klebsiella aerogenes]|uniref:phage tail fiber domain-containing protein n=1 Tax=Klebsiella aerogenes TaxID=548 RepID=UPI0021CB23BC|nr:phage tail fiber protein [Klebsiella aerogenes]